MSKHDPTNKECKYTPWVYGMYAPIPCICPAKHGTVEGWERQVQGYFCVQCHENVEHEIARCAFTGYEGLIGLIRTLIATAKEQGRTEVIASVREWVENINSHPLIMNHDACNPSACPSKAFEDLLTHLNSLKAKDSQQAISKEITERQ